MVAPQPSPVMVAPQPSSHGGFTAIPRHGGSAAISRHGGSTANLPSWWLLSQSAVMVAPQPSPITEHAGFVGTIARSSGVVEVPLHLGA